MSLVDDHIFVERVQHSGHYILSACVTDRLCDFSFSHSMQFYFYDGDEIDDMKQIFINDMETKGLIFDTSDYD